MAKTANLAECAYLNEVFEKMRIIIGPAPLPGQGIGNYHIRSWEGHKILAQGIWQLYRSHQNLSNFDTCLKLEKTVVFKDLKLAFNAIFKAESIQRITNLNPTLISTIKSQNLKEFENFQVIAFNGHKSSHPAYQQKTENRPAGYSPSTNAIFGDFANLDPRDWDPIFIHELGHRLDPIGAHLKIVNNLDHTTEIIKFLKSSSALSINLIEKIDQIIWSGLNIGFLAEWRVWCFVADYLSPAENMLNLGPETIWLKAFITEKDKSIRDQKMFEYLDPNFGNDSDTVQWINDPRVQERFIIFRECLRRQIRDHLSVDVCEKNNN